MPAIYKITYPNGKIYVGQDRTDTLTYFGSVNSELVAADFNLDEQSDFTIRKQILWYRKETSRKEITQKEQELILILGANNPSVGYNRWPRYLHSSVCRKNEDDIGI
ncbi:hypothetical protein LY56_01895 [Roseinatronobacter thiooxidans]|uniref:GIY-YIG nuclease family protein n=1 Tax=Roseinatronobacter thiooxidans TaxID=121821 RepID=A0A2W7R1Z5_9RHOB|nr:hypothetical protein [Roseinatronobacter thiooxidans]PZX44645.1 hypothetical protein LY56_01895 [Roseinatronobacter thiooxidans]